jgi:DNA-binding NarL/FixJ family response regulator
MTSPVTSPMASPIRILLADDHPVVRDGLVAILGTQPDFEVIGTAATGVEAVRLAGEVAPDVVLLDLAMPELDGVEALKRLRESSPAIRVIVLTAFDTDERIIDAVQAGAQGYLLKGAPREEIFKAVRVVHAGGSLLQPLVASKLLRYVRTRSSLSEVSVSLTPREAQVLRQLALGLQNKEIAFRLNITERTAKFHVNAILHKLGASNRTEALAHAAQRGLIKL